MINWNITIHNIIPTAAFGNYDTSDNYCQFTALTSNFLKIFSKNLKYNLYHDKIINKY